MKILVVTDLFPTPENPTHGIFIYQWAYHLAYKCELTIYQALWCGQGKHINEKTMLDFRRNFKPSAEHFNWIQKPLSKNRYDRLWLRTLKFSHFLKKENGIDFNQFDLIIGQMGCPGGFAAVKLARKLGKPSIVGLRGSDVTNYLKIPILRRLAKWTYSNCNKIVTVSIDLKNQILSLNIDPLRISVIKNGINPIFQVADKVQSRKILKVPDTPMILFVGHLIPLKGLKYLIKALPQIQMHRDCQLFLIGTGEEDLNLRELVIETGLSDRVHFMGNINQDNLVHWYNAADVFCLPSLREGIPNVMLESLACGTPVIATDIANNSEIINETNGVLVQPKNVEQLAKASGIVLSKEWNQNVISKTVNSFTWEKNRNKYLKQIKDLLSNERK